MFARMAEACAAFEADTGAMTTRVDFRQADYDLFVEETKPRFETSVPKAKLMAFMSITIDVAEGDHGLIYGQTPDGNQICRAMN